jgi:putative pyoverdin transport system ATP-binding/permease protein
MKFFTYLLKLSRGTVLLSVGVSVISGLSTVTLLGLIHSGLEKGTASPPALIMAFAGLCLVTLLTRFASGALLVRLGQNAIYDIRVKLSRRILAAPLRQLEEVGPHRLYASLTDDVFTISNTVTTFPVLALNASILVGGLAYMGWLSWVALVLVAGCIGGGIAIFRLGVMRGERYMRMARDDNDALFKGFHAMTEGTKELKLHHRRREAFLIKNLQRTARSVLEHNVRGMTVFAAASSFALTLIFVVIGVLVFALPRMTAIDQQSITSCVMLFLYLMIPLEALMSLSPTLSRAGVSLRKVEELGLSLLSESPEEGAAAGAWSEARPSPRWESLELRGVTHTYFRELENSSFSLGPVDMEVGPGELVFITGGNGSGKTTLAKLITGLYTPEAGEVRFNSAEIDDSNRESYRQNFSAVFTDFYLFDSLIGLDMPQLDARARQHLAALQIDHKVEVKDGVLSTTQLSQGQRKRLALLTAYMEDRPIYLFDEWAADQDPQFKEVFYYSLLPELKARGKTVLVITHDDRYYHIADRVIKLDYGTVVKAEAPSEVQSLVLP